MNSTDDGFDGLYLVPRIDPEISAFKRLKQNDPWFKRGKRLRSLNDLYQAAEELWKDIKPARHTGSA